MDIFELKNKLGSRAEAELARTRGEAWQKLRAMPEWEATMGGLLAALNDDEDGFRIDIRGVQPEHPEKIVEDYHRIVGAKLMLNKIFSIMQKWDDYAKIYVGSYTE